MDKIIDSLIKSLEFEKRHYRTYVKMDEDLLAGSYESVKRKLISCNDCLLHKTAHNKVMGKGNINADIMLIGEAPGANEDRQGEPFVGKAGEKLDGMLKYIDLTREDVYITNIVKCRPPGNRDPRSDEIEACAHFLLMEIEIIKPKFIMTLGRFASRHILEREGRMKDMSGNVFEKNGMYIVPTYHPSSLLMQKGKRYQETRKKIADDLKRLQNLLEEDKNG